MARTDPAPSKKKSLNAPASKRPYVKQSDIPSCSLDRALQIPFVLRDQYGKQQTTPLDVAAALGLEPQGRGFRMMAGASVAYGFTDGGAKADVISLTDLGLRVIAPTVEDDDLAARREGFLRPRVIREFLEKYDTSPLPTELIGRNVLEGMGVDAPTTEGVLSFIVEGAESLGLLREIGGKKYVQLRGTHLQVVPADDGGSEEEPPDAVALVPPIGSPDSPVAPAAPKPEPEDRRVYISHGSNKTIVTQLKSMLEYGEFKPVVSVELESTAKPVPKKVFDDMRSCNAGIIHVARERTITAEDGTEHSMLNENVLTEIGGAMALWGDNFILLVEEGTKLPSNLQGLYEVRYQGTTLDADATMKLLKAFKSFKS
jgi:hypothetical protein